MSRVIYINLIILYIFDRILISKWYKRLKLELEKFKQLLKEADFNKKSFSEYVNIPHSTVNGWGSINKSPVPEWVEKFLNLYIKDKKCNQLKDLIKNSGLLEEK